LPFIADKTKHEVEKAFVKNHACSQVGVTWQTDAIGFRKCDFGLPSHLLSPRQLQKQQSRNILIPPRKSGRSEEMRDKMTMAHLKIESVLFSEGRRREIPKILGGMIVVG
jgi:hypothetical protein